MLFFTIGVIQISGLQSVSYTSPMDHRILRIQLCTLTNKVLSNILSNIRYKVITHSATQISFLATFSPLFWFYVARFTVVFSLTALTKMDVKMENYLLKFKP